MILGSLESLIGPPPSDAYWMAYFFSGCLVLIVMRCFIAMLSGLFDYLLGRKKG